MIPDYFEFTLPTKLLYGIGIASSIGDAVKHFGERRALLVTDEILKKAGPVGKVKKGFKHTGIKIVSTFDKVPPNSTIKTVERCAGQARRYKCDMVIAVGGGSVIDTAKVANILIVKGGKVKDHMGAYLLDKNENLLPFIVFPTTAGTGSEVSKVAVIADPDNDVKLPFTEDQFLPQMAVLDPELTVTMPGKLTAVTGMDALTHAIEAYVDKEWSPASDGLALHAIRLIGANILQACAHPEDLQARGAMLVGSFLAGVAFSHSMVGMVHSISHALGGVYHIPHGLANALVLPEVMEYNLDSRVERYADIASALGITFPQVIAQSQSLLRSHPFSFVTNMLEYVDFVKDWVDSKSHKAKGIAVKTLGNFGFVDNWFRKQAAQAGIEKIRTLNRQLAYLTKMPLNLKTAGIDDNLAKLDQVANTAMEDGAMLYNPVEPEREAVVRIVKNLYKSRVKPLPVTKEDLRPASVLRHGKEPENIFKDADMLYDVLVDFYEELKKNNKIGPALKKAGLCVQFVYKNPGAVITIDATRKDILVRKGKFNGRPEVIMTMTADFAHTFWHGKANLISALTRRQVTAKGDVPKTLKLLPILKPAYELYPRFLRKKGLAHLIIT